MFFYKQAKKTKRKVQNNLKTHKFLMAVVSVLKRVYMKALISMICLRCKFPLFTMIIKKAILPKAQAKGKQSEVFNLFINLQNRLNKYFNRLSFVLERCSKEVYLEDWRGEQANKHLS